MRAEVSALLLQFAVGREGEYLKATGVGKDRSFPTVELMESTCFLYYIHAGTEIEMVGVAKYDFGFDIVAQLVLMHGFDCALSSHGHENRGGYVAVVGVDDTGAGI